MSKKKNDFKNKEVIKKVSGISNTSLFIDTNELERLQDMSLSKKVLVREGGFKGKLSLTSLHRKLIYLSSKDEDIKVSILIDIGATNSFMN